MPVLFEDGPSLLSPQNNPGAQQQTRPPPPYMYVPPKEGAEKESVFFEGAQTSYDVPVGTAPLISQVMQDDFFDDDATVAEEVGVGFQTQASRLAIAAYAVGLVEPEEVVDYIASTNRRLQSVNRRSPDWVKEYDKKVEDAGKRGHFSWFAALISNPAALGRDILAQTPNATIPLMAAYTGGKLGAKAGAVTALVAGQAGPQAATLEEIATVPLFAATAGTVGAALGSFSAGTIMETAAEIDQIFGEKGIDTTDTVALLAALKDPELSKEVKAKAVKKGLTVGAVDALFQAFAAGRILKAFKKSNKIQKGLAAAADVGVDSFGEGLGEALGQAAQGDAIDIREAALEAIYSVGQSTGQSAIGFSVRGGFAAERAINSEKYQQRAERVVGEGRSEVIGESQEAASVILEGEKSAVKKRVFNVLGEYAKGKDINIVEELGKIKGITEDARVALVQTFEKSKAEIKNKTDTLVREARVNALEKEVSSLDERIEAAEQDIVETEQKGGRVVRKNNALDKLIEQREDADTQIGQIREASPDVIFYKDADGVVITDQDVVTEMAADGTVLTKGRKIQSLGLNATRLAISSIRSTMRSATALAKNDAVAARKLVAQAVDDSPLSKIDKKAIKGSALLRNIETSEQALKAIPKLNSRITRTLQKRQRQNIKASLLKALKSTMPKKGGKRPEGKFKDPKIQSAFDGLRKAANLTQEDIGDLLAYDGEKSQEKIQETISGNLENIEAYYEGKTGADPAAVEVMILQNKILSVMYNKQPVSNEFSLSVLEEIEGLVGGARQKAEAQVEATKSRRKEEAGALTDSILRGKNIKDISRVKFKDRLVKAYNSFWANESWFSDNWYGALDVFFGATAEGRAIRNKYASLVAEGLRATSQFNIQHGNRFVAMGKDAYGINSSSKLQSKLLKDEAVYILKDEDGKEMVFEYEDGRVGTWEISRAEARKLYMELKDPKLRETLVSKDANAISQQMEDYLVNTLLTSEDKAFADNQIEMYKDIKPEVDEVYGRLYGIYLPDNADYSPIRREHSSNIGDANPMLEDFKARASGTPSFAKDRVSNNSEIIKQSDVTVMQRHITQAAHFIAMSEVAVELRSVFADKGLRKALTVKYGKTSLSVLDGYVGDFTAGGVKSSESFFSLIDSLNRNFAISNLALQPDIFFKQLVSFAAGAMSIPTKDFITGIADFAANAPEAVKTMASTPVMQDRSSSQDVSVIEKNMKKSKNVQSAWGRLKNKLATYQDMSMILTKLGDRGGIYLGGWPIYKYHINQGKSHDQAMREFEGFVENTQQSSSINQMSRFQTEGGPIGRAFTMYQTAPLAYWRQTKVLMREYSRGQISHAEFGKRAAILWVVLPQLFNYVAGAFSFGDDEEESVTGQLPTGVERNLAVGTLRGVPIAGPMFDYSVAYSQGMRWRRGTFPFLEGAYAMIEGAQQYDPDADLYGLETFLEGTGMFTGVSVGNMINQAEGAAQALDGDIEVGLKRASGWSEKISKSSAGKSSRRGPVP